MADATETLDNESELALFENTDQAVKFQFATVDVLCSSCQQLRATAVVKNLAYDKKVTFVYAQTLVQGVQRVEAHYVRSSGNVEVWEIDPVSLVPMLDGGVVNLWVEYEVNGRLYADRNSGYGYNISIDGKGPMVNLPYEDHVRLERSYQMANHLYQNVGGSIFVHNLGYEKDIAVVYTTDGWQTTKATRARYVDGPGSNQVERWNFVIPDPQAGAEFAISYTVNGQTFWDNNYGNNYFQAWQ